MATVYDIKPSELVGATAERLKGLMKKPMYIEYVKSGAHRERPPHSPDFWFIRSASILRQIYLNGPVGVGALRVRYGGRKAHVVHRMHAKRAGGSHIRDALMQLEALKLVRSTKAGRVITPQGRSLLDKISTELAAKA